jgi:hypothetical protein
MSRHKEKEPISVLIEQNIFIIKLSFSDVHD